MIVGIVLKERASLAQCRALQKHGGETTCFDKVKQCMNKRECMVNRFKEHHPQCMEEKGCAKGVEGCMHSKICHKIIVGCIDGP